MRERQNAWEGAFSTLLGKARDVIKDRGLLFPLLGALVAADLLSLAVLTTGRPPDPIAAFSLLVVSIGAGLILARFGRLGPFGGRLGMPGFEHHLRATLLRETARAARFHRELTIMAVRQSKAGQLNWRSLTRLTDETMKCRGGWVVLILPETTEEGAVTLLRRASLGCGESVQAIVVSPRAFGWNGEAVSRELCAMLELDWRMGEVMVNRSGRHEVVPLAA